MNTLKIDNQLLATMQIFGRATHVEPINCFHDELTKQLFFVVGQGDASKAIGKGGANVHRLEQMFKCHIKIVEYVQDPILFLRNLLSPLKVGEITQEGDGIFVIEPLDSKSRGFIIGRAASALRNLEKNMNRFFPVKEIKVLGGAPNQNL